MAEKSEPRATTPFRPDTLLASVAVLLVVNVVQRSIGFGRGVLFCRWLDPESLGHWDMAYGFLMLAAPVAVLGLPGSFGRYLERYRQRGQLRTFLVRSCLWTATLAGIAVGLLAWQREAFARLVFGDQAQQALMMLVVVTLAVVILHHFLEAVFAGLRLFRVVSAMHFAQSMLFAAISLTLLHTWWLSAWSIVVGYGVACGISAAGVMLWARRCRWDVAERAAAESHRAFWPPLLRFAVWVWVSNVLANLFSAIDRYMIVHFSGLPAEGALSLVGHYHTSMLVPLLLISVANLLSGAITPHLSHDWEQGERGVVAQRLGLVFKLTALGMFFAGIGILLLTPALFYFAFGGKYDTGLEVLPWTLASCVWFSLLLVAQTYVWCAEQTRRAIMPLAVGLVANVLLNLLLLPRLGLQGAVMATALATLIALGAQLLANHRLGMALSSGVAVTAAIPFGLALGTVPALVCAAILLSGAVFTPFVFTTPERQQIVQVCRARVAAIVPRYRRPIAGDVQG